MADKTAFDYVNEIWSIANYCLLYTSPALVVVVQDNRRLEDGLTADQVAELASAWALRHFADFEAAIVLHDDNERRIPHAHIVVNNTNLATERRLQTPDPLELNRSLQDLAEERGYRFMRNDTVREEDEGQTRKATPATLQSVYMRRAEREIQKEGGYSWVADIRNRVTVAKALARNEDEFMAVLEALEVDVSQNSETVSYTHLHLAATLVDLREQKRALVELAGHPLQVAPSVVQRELDGVEGVHALVVVVPPPDELAGEPAH